MVTVLSFVITSQSGSEVFSHNLADILSSPLKCLTTEFGMGSGRTTSLKPPRSLVYNIFLEVSISNSNHINYYENLLLQK